MNSEASAQTGAGTQALALLVISGTLLGIALPLSRKAMELGWSAAGFTFWSVLGAVILLTFVRVVYPHRVASAIPSRKLWRYGFWNGLLAIAWPQAMAFAAAPFIGTSVVALVVTLSAVFTYVLAVALRIEAVQWQRTLGIAIALTGAAALAAGRQGTAEEFSWLWFIAAISSPLSLAIGNIYRKRMMPVGVSSIRLAWGMLLGAAFCLFPVLLLSDTLLPAAATNDWWGWRWILLQAFFFALGFSVYFRLQKAVSPVYFSLLGYVMAVIGVVSGVLWFGEQLSLMILGAMLLVVLGVWLAGKR